MALVLSYNHQKTDNHAKFASANNDTGLSWTLLCSVRVSLFHQGASKMPSKVDLYQIGVWFCVGFFTGAGWAIAGWLVGRIFSVV
jgi:hypothetical protein